MALTDTAVRQAKPAAKPYALKDIDGLSLYVGPKGCKYWHFRFYWLGRQAPFPLAPIQKLASRTPAAPMTRHVVWWPLQSGPWSWH